MKTIKIILLTVVLLLSVYCGKDSTDETAAAKPAQTKQETKTPPAPKVDPADKQVILTINNTSYPNSDFKRFLMVQYPGIAENKPNPRLISRIFDSYVEHKIVFYIANQVKIPVDQSEYDEFISKVNIPDPTQPLDKEAVMDVIKVQKYLLTQVYSQIKVSNKEIKSYYNKNLKEYRKKRQVLLYQILVKDRESALKIRGQLKNSPQQFEELARNNSISIEAKHGGRMGYFEEGTLPKDMEKVVFSLETDTISPVVESSYGFHIFKVTEKKKGRLLFLKKVEKEIENKLMSDKLTNAYDRFLEQSKEQMKIVINHDALYVKYYQVPGLKNPYEGDTNNETTTSDDDPGV